MQNDQDRIKNDPASESEAGVRPQDFDTSEAPSPQVGAEDTDLAEPQGRWQKLRSRVFKGAQTRDVKSQERTRGLVILVGASLACLFLFFGLFTTDAGSSKKVSGTTPNLGRPAAPKTTPETINRSEVPQLTVNHQPTDEPFELTEKDLLATIRNRPTRTPPPGLPAAPKATGPGNELASVNFADPALAAAHRRQSLIASPRQTTVTDWEQATTDQQMKQQPVNASPVQPVSTSNASNAQRKSSLVFVRTSSAPPTGSAASRSVIIGKGRSLAPQGTALVARLQHGVSSAVKVPVTAIIEYNYENDGGVVVPAGTKAYGELSGATPQGWVALKFHSLEFPSGETEEIEGSALSMERQALRGNVSGQNNGKRFLTRALTGVGTIAAFAVGGRGLTGGIDNSILLRERVASNVALAGEQELTRLAYQQNIVVSVPANTRFYLVLQEPGMKRLSGTPRRAPDESAMANQKEGQRGYSEEELREVIQLRNEMREMNRLLQLSGARPEAPPNPDR